MVQSTFNRIEDNKASFEITVPAETVKNAINSAIQSLGARQKIKGFRQGKVPREVLLNLFGEEAIHAQALDKLIPDAYYEAVRQSGLTPIEHPTFEPEFPAIVPDEPLTFKAIAEVLPEIVLPDLARIPVDLDREVKITPEELETALAGVRKSQAQFNPVDRPCRNTDRLELEYELSAADQEKPYDLRRDITIVLGDQQLLPAIEKEIIGMKATETRSFPVDYPEDYQNEELAGKQVNVKVTINSVQEQTLPELTPELLKTIGGFETEEALRADLEKRIAQRKKMNVGQEAEAQALNFIIDHTPFTPPAKLVDEQIDNNQIELARVLERGGESFEQFLEKTGKSLDDLREQEYPHGERQVKTRLIMDELFRRENMQITNEMLQYAVLQYANRQGLRNSDVKKLVRNDEFLASVRAGIKESMILAFIRSRLRYRDDKDAPQAEEQPSAPEATEGETTE